MSLWELQGGKEGGRAIDWQLAVLSAFSSFCGSYVCSDVPPEIPLSTLLPFCRPDVFFLFLLLKLLFSFSLLPHKSPSLTSHLSMLQAISDHSIRLPETPIEPLVDHLMLPLVAPGLHSVRRRLYRRHLAMYQHLRILLLYNLCPHTQGSTALVLNLLCTFLRVSLMQQAPGDASL